ncbi:hypothetical protein SAMD00019534_020470 [Acytostelium subglobosum LB1]|uniref:hypothetical protein n=1 Tax=Acytostelium subglobosum LB1 TaxID=1410327 RepID=UPI000644D17E|nr:hypothetical protein SAMD00019534_020470 [Acytostelium subglobosum LB1]GAM18872.1 hypothetical protein SAMD00019534_020470 [Acytostelium subglobosum LB1]|eukprot:XP_012758092.1 hypothetical protein SAMD00019534_020470 [Acytostelium subglobosum LB1]
MEQIRYKPARRYVVHLDGDPEHMWDEPCRDYRPAVKRVEAHINKMYGTNVLVRSLQSMLGAMAYMNWVSYASELRGLSRELDVPVGALVFMQLIYEVSTCCTTAMSRDQDGNIVMSRTMDWDMLLLKDITIEADFHVGGRSIGVYTTWIGYVGVLTGISPKGFAVAINYRRTTGGSYWTNVKQLLKYCWPVGYLVREALITCQTYGEIVQFLGNAKIIAPCYITIVGKRAGTVMARNPTSVFRQSVLPSTHEEEVDQHLHAKPILVTDQDFLVQTNNEEVNDNEYNFLLSNERRCFTTERLVVLEPHKRTDDNLWSIMSVHPVLNNHTIYGCIIKPSQYSIETRVPHEEFGFL